ncbi:MAG: hypothetical protein GXP54_08500 [Deltaproteobacteria bacterium]|nr:hypothetical protein [Deltaproteobacteria bacterium]
MNEIDQTADTKEEARFKALVAARKRVIVRALISLAVLVIGFWALKIHEPGIKYFISGGDLVDFGDVRKARASGKTALDVKPGSYVRLKNLMVTNQAEGRKYKYFFCPIYNVLVRTTRPLPERSIRVSRAVIPDGLDYLVEQRRVWVEDFSTSFDVQGWIMPLKDMPGWNGGLRDYVLKPPGPGQRAILTKDEVNTAWALLDGESPASEYWAFIVLVSVIFVVLASIASLSLAVRAWRKAMNRP